MNKEFFVSVTISLKDVNNNFHFKNKAKREKAICPRSRRVPKLRFLSIYHRLID